MANITGRTFDHRAELKLFGAKWNAATKTWSLSDDSLYLDDVRKWAGVTVSGVADQRPTEATPPAPVQPIDIEVADEDHRDDAELTELVDGWKAKRPAHNDMTMRFGDTVANFERFNASGATMYAEFSSIMAMADYVEGLPRSSMAGGYAWLTNDYEWYQTRNMAQALAYARGNWPEGVALAQKVMDILSVDHPTIRTRKHAMAGGSVNVGRMLNGNPVHMRKHPKGHGKRVVTLFSNFRAAAMVDAQSMVIRAACVAAMADLLEASGWSCEIIGFRSNVGRGQTVYQVVTLKHAGEPISVSDIIFGLGHPSMMRRFGLAIDTVDIAMKPFCNNSHGRSFDPAIELGRNEFVLDEVPPMKSFNGSLDEQVREMFNAIIPSGFPIKLRKE